MFDLFRFIIKITSFITHLLTQKKRKLEEMERHNEALRNRIRILEENRIRMMEDFVKRLQSGLKDINEK
jgi:uncharacterized protein YecE (DUF72 family)